MPRTADRTGYGLVLVVASCFVSNAGVSRVVLRAGIDPTLLTTIRCTGTMVVLLAVLAATRPSALRLPARDIPMLLVYGISGVALVQWLYFVAIDRLPVGVALLLEFTAPVFVALYARLVQREPMRTRFWLALGLAVGGLAMVVQVWRGGWLDGIGLLAGLGAALALASYYLFSERGVGRRDPLSLTFWAFVVASAFWNTFRPVWELDLDSTGRSVSLLGALANVELPLWSLLLWIVVVGTVVPFVLTVAALRHLSATAAIVVEMLEPVGAAVLGWAWFGESLAALQVTGGVAVLVGIVLAQTARRPSPALLTQ